MPLTMKNQWRNYHDECLESLLFRDVEISLGDVKISLRDFIRRYEDFIVAWRFNLDILFGDIKILLET